MSRSVAAVMVCGTIVGLWGVAAAQETLSPADAPQRFSEYVKQQLEADAGLSGLLGIEVRQGPVAATLRVKDGVLFARSRKVDQSAREKLDAWATTYCRHRGVEGLQSAVEVPPYPNQDRAIGCESADKQRLIAAFRGRDGGDGLLVFDIYDEQETPAAVLSAERAQVEQQRAERQKRIDGRARYMVELKRKAVVPSGKKLPTPVEVMTNEFLQDLAKAGGGYAQRLQEPGNERRASRAREVWADLKFGYKFPGVDAAQAGAELAFEE